MSVHTHELLSVWCNNEKHKHKYVFSYLDPRHLSLRFAKGMEVRIGPENCQLSLANIVKLHGWRVRSSQDRPILADFCDRLAKQLGDPQTLRGWRQWCDWNLRSWGGTSQWERTWKEFQATGRSPSLAGWVTADTAHEAELQALIKWIHSVSLRKKKSDLGWVTLHPAIPGEARNLADLRAALEKDTCWKDDDRGFGCMTLFLDGGWLENYVLRCILDVAEECQIHEAIMDIQIDRNGGTVFQFDVAAMKGYQLFAFSCSTATDSGLNKHKLFEAYTRARQMGGEEARVALVGGYDDPQRLLEEVNEQWIAPLDMIRVFGPANWPNLREKMKKWFNRQSSL